MKLHNILYACTFATLFVVFFVLPGMMWEEFFSGYLWETRGLDEIGDISYVSGVLTRFIVGGLAVWGLVWQVTEGLKK